MSLTVGLFRLEEICDSLPVPERNPAIMTALAERALRCDR
jgi:hypothetical protein